MIFWARIRSALTSLPGSLIPRKVGPYGVDWKFVDGCVRSLGTQWLASKLFLHLASVAIAIMAAALLLILRLITVVGPTW